MASLIVILFDSRVYVKCFNVDYYDLFYIINGRVSREHDPEQKHSRDPHGHDH